jgi:phosphohistidine phosphatase
MRLVLVRHGEAEPYSSRDAERALTPRGMAQARQTAEWLAANVVEQGLATTLLVSPYRRAQETASALGERLPLRVRRTLDTLTPDIDPRRALSGIDTEAQGADVLVIVSHMPLVAALAHWLQEGVPGAGRGFALAEARVLETDGFLPGLANMRERFIPGLSL